MSDLFADLNDLYILALASGSLREVPSDMRNHCAVCKQVHGVAGWGR